MALPVRWPALWPARLAKSIVKAVDPTEADWRTLPNHCRRFDRLQVFDR